VAHCRQLKKLLLTTPRQRCRWQVLAVEEAATQLLVSLESKRSEAVRGYCLWTRQVRENFERLGPRPA